MIQDNINNVNINNVNQDMFTKIVYRTKIKAEQ